MSSDVSKLLVRPDFASEEYVRITPETAGWENLSFAARRLSKGGQWRHATGENEMAVVVLGGTCHVQASCGNWNAIGRRANVFAGMPYALYLPRRTSFTLEATSESLDIAYGWCATDQDHVAQLITPLQSAVEIRGGGNATRQINGILSPGFDCHRLVVVEVYTPSGNWSSYPPHKHDVHRVDECGRLLEADLEEIYFYKFDRPSGYAYQHIYTSDAHLDEMLIARDSHVVLSPEGYHPVVTAPGYNCYYLNMLAGSAQSLANSDDPEYAWVKGTWTARDPRLPLVSLAMEVKRPWNA